MRPPYGRTSEHAADIARRAGLRTIEYELASGDPDPTETTDRIVHRVLREARPGSIIVFHVNARGVHTAEALPAVIAGLRKQGFELVTVGQLLEKGV